MSSGVDRRQSAGLPRRRSPPVLASGAAEAERLQVPKPAVFSDTHRDRCIGLALAAWASTRVRPLDPPGNSGVHGRALRTAVAVGKPREGATFLCPVNNVAISHEVESVAQCPRLAGDGLPRGRSNRRLCSDPVAGGLSDSHRAQQGSRRRDRDTRDEATAGVGRPGGASPDYASVAIAAPARPLCRAGVLPGRAGPAEALPYFQGPTAQPPAVPRRPFRERTFTRLQDCCSCETAGPSR